MVTMRMFPFQPSSRGLIGASGAPSAEAAVEASGRAAGDRLGVAALAVLIDAVAGDVLGAGVDVGARVVAVAAAEARREAVAVVIGQAARRRQQGAQPQPWSATASNAGDAFGQPRADDEADAPPPRRPPSGNPTPSAAGSRARSALPGRDQNQKRPCALPSTSAAASA